MKAFVFTFDAAIALLIAGALLVAFSATITNSKAGETLALQQTAQDTLLYLENQGTLDSILGQSDAQATAVLQQFTTSAFSASTGGRITISAYQYSTGPCGNCNLDGNTPINGFCKCRSLTVSKGTATSVTSIAKRVFQDGTNYAIATMEVWRA